MSAPTPTIPFDLPPALQALVERHRQQRAKTTADRSLAQRLRGSVRQSDVKVSGVAFYVHDGVISVYGTVRDAAARDALLAVVAKQPGVRRIIDYLRMSPA